MMQKLKKPISIVLSIMMVLSLFTIVPITASAETTDTVYDSGGHDASELNTGDYIVSGIESLTDENSEYTITLKAGTYTDWPDGESAYDEDYTIKMAGLFDIATDTENVLCFTDWMEGNYIPFVDGKIADAFYVESADHDAKTITLAGANYSAEEPATEEPTTVEPTTAEPTTEPAPEPTTAEPTTAEPTTAEPTTAEPPTDPAPADIYTVAGSSAAMFGTTWDSTNTANDMTKGDGGVYSITYTDVQPEDAIQLKVVKNHSWAENWGDKETGDNYTFNVVSACDVTVTFDPATETVNVTGDGVTQDTELDVYSVIAVGNGEDTYLNGANWDPCDPANAMTKVADGIWEFSMDDIYAFDNYNIKFAVNSVDEQGNPTSNPWAHNFGSEVEQLYPTGEALDAVYNGKNCIFEVEEDGSTVKFQLDLRDFDFATKTGAKMTITVTGPEPVEYTTAEPSTEETTTPEEVGTVRVIARNDTYTTTAGAPWDGVLVDEEVAIDNDSNMKTAIVDALTKNGVDFTYSEWGYFQMVGGLNEYEADGSGGWMISLNDWFMNGGAEDFTVENNKLKDGDEIVIMYTLNWGADVGAPWGTLDTRLKSLDVSNGELDSEFDSDDLSYDLKITNGEGVKLTPVPINKNYQVRIYKNEYTPEAEGTELNKNAVIDVEDGDTLYIGIGNPSWPTMETESTETVYQIRINPAAEPTTAEPTTAEPTTAEPTTAEPTTAEPTTEPAVADIYTVAGSSAAMFGTTWDATNTANDMAKGGDGVYSITYTDVQPEDAIQLKVVKNRSWAENWGDKDTGDNYTFNVVEACDVTVTFDPATETVNVTGDGVTQDTDLDVYSVIAVGNGEDTYLNGANWDPCDPANAMTKVADGIWEFSMADIYAFDNYNIKFAVNSVDDQGNPTSNPWAHNFGSEAEQLYPTGEALDAVYNGKNCIFEVEEDGSTVKFQLDLRNFDFATKQGAKMTITVTAPTPPPAPVVVYADDLNPGDSITSASKVFDTGDYTVVLKGSTYASFTPEFTTVQEDDKSFPPKTFIYKPEDGIIFDVPLNQGLDPYEAILDPGTFDRYVPVDAQGERTNVLYVIDKTDDTITLGGYNKPVDDVTAMINALPDPEDVTVDTETALINARAAYDALTDAQKAMIDADTYEVLEDAEAAIADLTAVDNVETLISNLPVEITLADKDNIEAARAAYNALTDAQKAMVNQGIYQDLVNAESLLADLTAVNDVETLINNLPDPTQVNVVDKPDVEAARAAYNALTDTQKAIVNADILQKLADDEQRIADIIAAGVVNQMIMQNIPSADEVTLADEQTINSVREAYDALTDAQKDLIEDDVYKKLADAEKSIADQKAAAAVEALIDALPAKVTLDDTADVTDASAAYNALTDEQKALVDEDKVQKLRDLEKSIMDQQSAADVEALIEALPSATDVTLDDKAQIDFAGESYENLSDEQKELVPAASRIKLGAVQIALALVEKDAADKAAAAEVTELIEALPSATSVAPWDAEDIEAARAAYDALTDDQKALVSTQNKLKLLLVEAALPIAIDNAAAEEVEELIEALPDAGQVTVDDKDAIEEASDAYDALTAGQKQLLKLADRLKLQNVKAALEQAIDEAAADEVEAMIEDLPDAAQVTVLDKEAIDAAAEAYDNLTDNQKKLVLLADRVKLAAVKAALENAEDLAAADAVEELIEALPNAADVTVDDEEAIDAAGAAYNALTDNQKKLVVLADRIKLQNVQAALAKAINDAEAAQKVTDQINALPEAEDITLDDLKDVAAARVAYTLLTPDQKALVPEETLNKLVVDEAVIAEIIPAEAVKVAINNLPAPEDLKLADKDLVEAVRNAYEDLTDYQKALIDEDTYAKLTDAEAAIEAIEADKAVADAVAEQIKALPAPLNVTVDDKDDIEAVKEAYDELTDAQKDLVSAADKLKLAAVLIALDTAEKIAEDEAAADEVEQMIEALPDAADVTVDDEEAIDAAGAAYNALTDDQKRMVVLADRIKLQNVQNALAKAINDAEAAQKVIDQINALPEAEDITFDDLKDVAAATLAYALLTHDQKQLVDEDTRAKLTAAQDALDDLFEVEGVKAMINALPDAEDVTINDKAFIEAVRENYDALTDAQKALIDDDTYAKLTDAEDALEAIEEDIAAAQEVSEQIRELPSALRVTVDDKDDIEAVKEAYDALTDAQKAFVPTADKLKLAAVLIALDAAEKIAEDEAAADAVEEMIEALPDPADVTIDDKDDIDAAVEAYNALTDDQKRLVVLADRIKLALDDAVLQKIENDIAAAEAVTEKIEALPEAEDVTVEDFDAIMDARDAYNALTDDQKALVDEDTLAKLAADEAALADAIEVEFVKALINELPAPEDVTIYDEFFIEAVRDWYDELSDAQKDMIDEETYQKLVDAEEALAALTKFTVTWMNGDEVLEVDTDLPSGATPHYDGETPTKATDDQYVYEFMGWDPDLALVTSDVTYNAVFDTYLIGDVNMDGAVDIFDAVEIQKYASGKEPLTELQLRIADINKDGNVDILDASAIQRITSQ